MNEENKQIIEINGIKMEVDLRTAKRIDQFKVGDAVKLLITETNTSEVKYGVIVDFENFQSLPTIVVAYVGISYWDTELKFAHVNAKSRDKYEIVATSSDTMLSLDKASMVDKMNKKIEAKRAELEVEETKKKYFLQKFGMYFSDEAEASETA